MNDTFTLKDLDSIIDAAKNDPNPQLGILCNKCGENFIILGCMFNKLLKEHGTINVTCPNCKALVPCCSFD